MIEKLNITIQNKLTKKIFYKLYLDGGEWIKYEYDTNHNKIYYEDDTGYWFKSEFNSNSYRTYFENIYGVIKHNR